MCVRSRQPPESHVQMHLTVGGPELHARHGYALSRHDVGKFVLAQLGGAPGAPAVVQLGRHCGAQRFCVHRDSHADVEVDFARLDFALMRPVAQPACHGLLTGDETLEDFASVLEAQLNFRPKRSAVLRLHSLLRLVWHSDSVVFRQRSSMPEGNCVLGFESIVVDQPAFYQEVCALVRSTPVWNQQMSASSMCKNTTAPVYELLRQIGVKPGKHSRGPPEHDPGKREFMYAKRFSFCNLTLRHNEYRLKVAPPPRGSRMRAPALRCA